MTPQRRRWEIGEKPVHGLVFVINVMRTAETDSKEGQKTQKLMTTYARKKIQNGFSFFTWKSPRLDLFVNNEEKKHAKGLSDQIFTVTFKLFAT